ncbi:molybdopterin-dependent oxidoreductase [Salinisphaera sp. T31B1]|uniref:molybdopterin-dependent oxidoreductase n=1 Tax=Salinisphaera sp. T31B1 TaxID=727963 RepID=UPI0033417E1B
MKAPIPGFCTLCRSRCGTLNTVVDDRLIQVQADPDHPTGRATCAKGRAAPELVHSGQRLLYPMRRTQPKGAADPGWQRIGWDKALAEIADRLAEIRDCHGAEGVAFSVTTPSGTPMSDSIDWVERFIRLYGSPNTIYATELCNWHKDFAHAFTFGCAMPTADYAQARLNILWGHNPSTAWLSQAGTLGDSDTRGALLVVDPRATAHARAADLWLAIHPGTDGALALGLAQRIIERRGYDEAFLRHWSDAPLLVDEASGRFVRADELTAGATGFVGWDSQTGRAVAIDTRRATDTNLAARLALHGCHELIDRRGQRRRGRPAFAHYRQACQSWTPARTAAETGLAETDIERAADMIMAAGDAVSYHGWTGIGQHDNATQTERAIATLYALTGSFDRPGGNRIHGPLPIRRVNDISLLDPCQRDKALGRAERPLGPAANGWVTAADVYDAALTERPYRIRALFGFGGNFLVSQPDPALGARALEALDFHVHCDLFHTPTNSYADILLPVNTPWEREGLRPGFEIDERAAGHIQLRPRMVAPRGESRADYEIVMALADRLGLGEAFFGGDIEAGWNHMLAPLGLDVAALRACPAGLQVAVDSAPCKYARTDADGRVAGFATDTRRVTFYAERLHRHGYPPVPCYTPPGPQDGDRPLRLVTVKDGYYCHSQHRHINSLRRRSPDPRVALAPATAKSRGIEDGQWVELSGDRARVTLRARFDTDLAEDVVIADYGWWQGCTDLGLSDTPIEGAHSRNINAVFDSARRDPLSGAIALRSATCEVRPLDDRPHWSGLRALRVTAIERETADIVSITLAAVDGAALAPFHPGQHLPLSFILADGRRHERCYSLSGPAVPRPGRYRISVKRLVGDGPSANGLVSHHVNDALAVGDIVSARMPAGMFRLPVRHTAPIVLIAGGIGITPFLSLLETLAVGTPQDMPDIHLLYANRCASSHAFAGRIAELTERLPRLKVIDIYSAPGRYDRLGHDYDRAGRIDDTVIDTRWLEARARFYLCGPAAMMTDLRARLVGRGVFAFEIFSEAFSPPAPTDARALAPRRIRLARSNVTLDWSPDQGTILASAEQAGLSLPSGCRVGQCESCALRIIAGRVHTPAGIAPVEPDTCLTCQAVPLTDIELDA